MALAFPGKAPRAGEPVDPGEEPLSPFALLTGTYCNFSSLRVGDLPKSATLRRAENPLYGLR
jgi:hypothetical protein